MSYGSVPMMEDDSIHLSAKSAPGPLEDYSELRSNLLKRLVRISLLLLACIFVAFLAVSSGFTQFSTTPLLGLDATPTRITYTNLSEDEQTELFLDFLTKYSKTYTTDSEEYATRLSNFKANLAVMDERNSAESDAMGEGVHGITKFSDLTQEEYESTMLMSFYEEDEYSGTDADKRRKLKEAVVSTQKSLIRAKVVSRRQSILEAKKYTHFMNMGSTGTKAVSRRMQEVISSDVAVATISFVDWTDAYTTPVNDQGTTCPAASWAFAAAQQIESDAIRKGYLGTSDSLSVQQLLDCNTGSDGCTSGSLESAYDYSSKINGGLLHWASQYPYVGSTNTCSSADSDYATTLGSYATVTKYHNEEYGYTTTQVESNMLAHLVATGTLSACVDGSTWNTYVSGAMTSCTGSTINLCVQVVGVYYDPVSDAGYYKVRNSFGQDWGEDGYMRLAHGVNACNLVYNPGYTDPASSLAR